MSMLSRLATFGSAVSKNYVEDVFSTWLYGGTGATQTITNAVNLSGQGGLVWIKRRESTNSHRFVDTARGATKSLDSNSIAGEATESTGLTAFNADGFTIGADADYNTNNAIYAAWTFRKQAKFFDIVTYTGNGANRTIAHNLGSAPGCMIIKRTNTTGSWAVYHRSLAVNEGLLLNSNAALFAASTYWNNTAPTSSVFSLGTSTDVNASGGTYVAYLFAHDAGGFGDTGNDNVISCGMVNPSASYTAVNLGWEPQWVMIKAATATGSWNVVDNMRGFDVDGTYNKTLVAEATTAEAALSNIKINATGFEVTSALGSSLVYIAIRRGPMKTPTDATKVFMPTVYTGTNVDNRLVNTTIAPDMAWFRMRSGSGAGYAGFVVGDRLRGQPWLKTGATQTETTTADGLDQQIVVTTEYGTAFSSMNGVWVGNNTGTASSSVNINANTTSNNHVVEAFKRAPGFFDIVCYTGTGSNTTVSHNLGVVPELMLVKNRDTTGAWAVYCSALANTEYLVLNTNAAKATGATYWNSTTPGTTTFSIGTAADVNASASTYAAYLFASCPGVSKIGTYFGNGSSQTIDCGFIAGARFVLIKRTDSTGDWLVADTARGIVAGNDPLLRPNTTGAEATGLDWIDADNSGFVVNQEATTNANVQGGITWTSQTSGFGTTTINAVTYGNGLYVAVGQAGTMTTSTDGITWTTQTSGFGTTNINGVTYGNGLYVAVGASGTMTTSTGGTTWTSRTSGFAGKNINGVTYGNGLFVAVGNGGTMTTSTDGTTWTSRTSGFGGNGISGVTYGNGLFVAVGANGTLTTSTDGITWTSQTSGFGTTTINGVTYGNGLFVAVGNGGTLTTSTDGTTWTSRTSGFGSADIYGVTYGNGLFVAVGANGTLTTSTDGITWTSQTSGFGTIAILGVTYGNGLFVAVGAFGTMTTSITPRYIYLAIA